MGMRRHFASNNLSFLATVAFAVFVGVVMVWYIGAIILGFFGIHVGLPPYGCDAQNNCY